MFKQLIGLVLFCLTALHAHENAPSRGIIMAAADKYMHIALPTIAFLRLHHKSTMPIEVWHAGDELSEDAKALLSLFQPIQIRDIQEKYNYPPEFFRGFQIKGFICDATNFSEFILMDADVFLYMKPEELFDLPDYKANGAFFFRDKNSPWKKSKNGFSYSERRDFLLNLIPKPSSSLPEEWQFYWNEEGVNTKEHRERHHVESGVVVINKKEHLQAIKCIKDLNENFKETYKVVLGDKETYWMGFEMAKETYAINPLLVYSLVPNPLFVTYDTLFHSVRSANKLVQLVGDRLCFQQKVPVPVSQYSFLKVRDKTKWVSRSLRQDEIELIQTARQYYKIFHRWDELLSVKPNRHGYGFR